MSDPVASLVVPVMCTREVDRRESVGASRDRFLLAVVAL